MKLTVIILSHNVRDLLKKSIQSVIDTYRYPGMQIIVVDNASSDDSVAMVHRNFPKVDVVVSQTNVGFSAGNNLAREITRGEAVLFLNPDTVVKGNAIGKCMEILNNETELGAITCRVELQGGKIDYSCHRGLPTPWNSFCYLAGLSGLFPKTKLFSGYTATYLDTNTSHNVECITGAFLLIKRKLLDQINWWDQDYWWNGEDIELCYQIKKAGYKIRYEPSQTIIHYKGSSAKQNKVQTTKSGVRVMRIFTDKHWRELGPWPVMLMVRMGIYLLEKYRLWKLT